MEEIDLESLGGDNYWKYMQIAWVGIGAVLAAACLLLGNVNAVMTPNVVNGSVIAIFGVLILSRAFLTEGVDNV